MTVLPFASLLLACLLISCGFGVVSADLDFPIDNLGDHFVPSGGVTLDQCSDSFNCFDFVVRQCNENGARQICAYRNWQHKCRFGDNVEDYRVSAMDARGEILASYEAWNPGYSERKCVTIDAVSDRVATLFISRAGDSRCSGQFMITLDTYGWFTGTTGCYPVTARVPFHNNMHPCMWQFAVKSCPAPATKAPIVLDEQTEEPIEEAHVNMTRVCRPIYLKSAIIPFVTPTLPIFSAPVLSTTPWTFAQLPKNVGKFVGHSEITGLLSTSQEAPSEARFTLLFGSVKSVLRLTSLVDGELGEIRFALVNSKPTEADMVQFLDNAGDQAFPWVSESGTMPGEVMDQNEHNFIAEELVPFSKLGSGEWGRCGPTLHCVGPFFLIISVQICEWM